MMCENPSAAACPYEVGDILATTNSKAPSKRWPGTEWAQIKDRFLLAAGDSHAIGSTGGEAEHYLQTSELPKYTKGQVYTSDTDSPKTSGWLSGGEGTSIGYGSLYLGDGKAHNNMPPYEAVFIWKRTK